MADLMSGGGGPATSNGNGMASPRRPTVPAPTGSPSGIRTPRAIMQQREEREARRRADAERRKAELRRIEQEEEERNAPARQPGGAAAAGGVAGAAAGVASRPDAGQQQSQMRQSQAAAALSQAAAAPNITQTSHQRTNSARYAANQALPSQVYGGQSSQRPQHTQPQAQQQQPQASQQQSQPAAVQTGDNSSQAPGATTSSKPRNSFPHAFERWETLSAHWEGLTSYWIRRLEQNKDELNRDPLNQQLARQVTDLSAAGANLFHAVVELQRLRASSERKFQRWFFETRTELERAQEMNSLLDDALQKERNGREEAIRDAVDREQGSSLAEKQLAEMRKELAISKDEARRAWEELGRREQSERERTNALLSGHPINVGGVQAVPMTQGPAGQLAPGNYAQEYEQAGYTTGPAQPSQPSQPGPSHSPEAERYYRQAAPAQQSAGGSERSGYSEGQYATDIQGRPVLDIHGNRIPLAVQQSSCSESDAEVDDYDTPATTNPPSRSHEPPSTSAPPWSGNYSEDQDYTGEGFAAPGWETVPRHHHPTRLSDVIEEDDERSRTSASHVSRG